MRNRVREIRELMRLTQAELAASLGVSRQTIISIERERFDPSLPLAFLLADRLGTSVDELFNVADSPGAVSP